MPLVFMLQLAMLGFMGVGVHFIATTSPETYYTLTDGLVAFFGGSIMCVLLRIEEKL